MEQTNVFIALADALWARGEDGELIALELARAFKWITDQAYGSEAQKQRGDEFFDAPDIHEELNRLLELPK